MGDCVCLEGLCVTGDCAIGGPGTEPVTGGQCLMGGCV